MLSTLDIYVVFSQIDDILLYDASVSVLKPLVLGGGKLHGLRDTNIAKITAVWEYLGRSVCTEAVEHVR